MSESSYIDKLPVFTTPPHQITFYEDDPSSYQQSLTIVNPYDFDVKFKILVSPDCSKYSISNSHGTIMAHHTVTVTLYHLAVNPSNIGVTDKVRVYMYNAFPHFRASGKRDLTVVLLETGLRDRTRSQEVDRFQQLEGSSAVQGQLMQQPLPMPNVQEQRSNNKVLYIAAIILGIIVLAMPKEGDINEYFPNILPRPTSEMKHMACFLLGILCTLLFQS